MPEQYTFFSLTSTTDAWVPAYDAVVPGLVVKHGGRILVQASDPVRIEGEPSDADPEFIGLIVWPSKDAELAFLNDPDYAPHEKARLEQGVNNTWSVPGLD